jgi:serine/threonine-protein kinase OSR1/STK39
MTSKQNADTTSDTTDSVPLLEWPTEPSSYSLLGKIGQGAFASVWKARTQESNECAVKVLDLDHFDTNLAEIRSEVQALRLSSHPNVLACYTAFVNDRSLWLVTQLMRKGSSLHCLHTARLLLQKLKTPIPMEDHITYILHETLLGLQYIHENGQIHRDVKAGNILLDWNGDVRIADFGVSGWLVQEGAQQEKAKTFVGTPCWMAPEVMEQIHGYDYKADIWSLGITAMELAKGYAPYAKYPAMKVLILTIQEDPPSMNTYNDYEQDDYSEYEDYPEEAWSKSFCNMIQMCMQKNPGNRPTCQELLTEKHFGQFAEGAYLQDRRQRIKTDICDIVADVGNAPQTTKQVLPGNIPVSIVLPEETDRPEGTTWVFADGSQVLASRASALTVDDALDELDEFTKQLGGEHYGRNEMQPTALRHHDAEDDDGDDNDDDDLDDFLDEFEKTTAGENFSRSR